ncbi:hypothetical protein ACFL2S_10255 [Thermodesulfobacteriota bacterium]
MFRKKALVFTRYKVKNGTKNYSNAMRKILSLILVLLQLIVNLSSAFADDSACSYFYSKLSELPHIKLTKSNNGFKSLWDGKWAHGCEIIFKSHESIISGDKVYETFQSLINTPYWIIDNNLSADGPGSSSVSIEKDKSKCTIHWSQHAWIDEESGEQRQSSDIEMIIQCMPK